MGALQKTFHNLGLLNTSCQTQPSEFTHLPSHTHTPPPHTHKHVLPTHTQHHTHHIKHTSSYIHATPTYAHIHTFLHMKLATIMCKWRQSVVLCFILIACIVARGRKSGTVIYCRRRKSMQLATIRGATRGFGVMICHKNDPKSHGITKVCWGIGGGGRERSPVCDE